MNDEKIMMVAEYEKIRRESLPRLSEAEWLEIFPEAVDIIPTKIAEWSDRRRELERLLDGKIKLSKKNAQNEFDFWFCCEWFRLTILDEIFEAEKQIRRLKNLLPTGKTGSPATRLSDSLIEKARLVPVVNIAMQSLNLRKRGKNYFSLCPFHTEKTPSFCIYPETNSFVCFGCNQSGDVITYVMLINNFNFKEAVLWLLERY